ncbi:hypothetical protein QR680_003762 [Steinernema hermaphroditum]|uniref:ATP-dependent RNA helicase n=1 Tax=Steinernema hermaphroditum TaxID=289476 RepID=A0AA39LSI3_9BILA|nr:hypothetical protein QR680_003762 [Steinernema hermaphroditum]
MDMKQKYFSDSSDTESEHSVFSDEEDERPQVSDEEAPTENPNMQGVISEDEDPKRGFYGGVWDTQPTQTGPNFDQLTDISRIHISGGDGEAGFIHSIDDYSFAPSIARNFKALGCKELTAVQKATWFLMLHKPRHHLLTRAQTGCGKTFAFLVPLLQKINELKNAYRREKTFRPRNAPFALVFAPSQQLVKQICNYAQRLAHGTQIKVASSVEKFSLKGGCDVYVTTGGGIDWALDTATREYPLLQLNHVAFTVIDEADRFNGDTQEESINAALTQVQHSKPDSRLYVFSATLSDEFVEFMGDDHFQVFDSSPVPDTIDHKTLILHPKEGKTAIVEMLRHIENEHGGVMPSVLIFTNRRDICDILAFWLTSFGFPAFPFSAKFSAKSKEALARRFTSGQSRILISTDVMCAGIDWDIDVVINYHLPPRDQFSRFFHRIGRTGRAGRKGQIYSFFYTDHGIMKQIDADEFVKYLDLLQFHVPLYLRNYYAENQLDGQSYGGTGGVDSADPTRPTKSTRPTYFCHPQANALYDENKAYLRYAKAESQSHASPEEDNFVLFDRSLERTKHFGVFSQVEEAPEALGGEGAVLNPPEGQQPQGDEIEGGQACPSLHRRMKKDV